VVQPLTPPGDEETDIRLRRDWFQQLNARGAVTKEGDANIGKTFVALKVEPEEGFEVGTG
jgi:hypothetical protein